MCTRKSRSCPWFYPLVVFVFIATVYTVYMALVIIPQYIRLTEKSGQPHSDPHAVDATYPEIISITIAFHLLLLMVFLTYFKAMYTCPGYIPQTSFWREGEFVILERDNNTILDAIKPSNQEITDPRILNVIRSIPVVERKQGSGKFRLCTICNTFKPDRSHHCSACGKCILRMDHHCPWVGNCIGYGNYRYFMQLLFYVNLTLIFVISTMVERVVNVFQPIIDLSYFFREDFVVCIIFLMCVFLCAALSAFLVYHLKLIHNAVTTIELKEKSQSKDESVRRRWYVANIKYNLGTFRGNFQHIMGKSFLGWIFPTADPTIEDDAGTYRYGPWSEYMQTKTTDTS